MITVLYFASLRELLGLDQESLSQHPKTLGELRNILAERYGEAWQQAANGSKLLAAINQEMAEDTQTINAGDEIAFFPPVTGG